MDVCYGTILEFSRRTEENNVELISAWLMSCPNLEPGTSYTIQTGYNYYNLSANLLQICSNSDLTVSVSNTANRHVA
jgi:hypothetical protein